MATSLIGSNLSRRQIVARDCTGRPGMKSVLRTPAERLKVGTNARDIGSGGRHVEILLVLTRGFAAASGFLQRDGQPEMKGRHAWRHLDALLEFSDGSRLVALTIQR